MFRIHWLHQLTQRWFPQRGTARHRRTRRVSAATRRCVKPRLEALEDRCVPTAVAYHDGPILNNVQVENVFYGSAWNTPANQQLQQRINQFTAYLVQSPYMDMLNQYHGNGVLFGNNYVGRGSLYGSKVYEGSVSGTVATQDIVNNLIAGVLGPNGTGGGGLPALPSFDNLYIVYLPPGISNDLALKIGAYAYHSSKFLGQPPWNIPPDAPVPSVIQYVIAPYPGQGNPQPSYIPDQFNALTVAISHELAESVTDPNLIWANQSVEYPNVGTGWYETTGTHTDPNTGKTVVSGQEIGDLAEGYTGLLNGYLVQAEWSNLANSPVLPSGSIWKTIGSGSSSIIGADTPGAMTGPQGKPDSYVVANNLNLFVNSAQGVLANDTDVFNNPLQAVLANKPSHGQLLYFNPDGSFAYSPASGYVGTDTFTYVPSDGTINGNPVTVTIYVAASSTTLLSVSAANVPAGQAVTLRATVTDTAANANVPQGAVTFFNGSNLLGTVPLVNGMASLNLPLPVGANNIRAQYNGQTTGDFSIYPSTSNDVAVTVSSTVSSTNLSASSTSVQIGQSVTLTAMVTPTPSGSLSTVTFYDGSTVLGTVPVGSDGTATLTTANLHEGDNAVTATYNGNASFAPSASNAIDVFIPSLPQVPPPPPPPPPPPILPPTPWQLLLDGVTLAIDLSERGGLSAVMANAGLVHDIETAPGGLFNPFLDAGFSAVESMLQRNTHS